MKLLGYAFSFFFALQALGDGSPISAGDAKLALSGLTLPEVKTNAVGSQLPTIQGSLESCRSSAAFSMTMCLSDLSPTIQSGAALISSLMSTMGSVQSNKEGCKKFGSAMDIAKTTLTAYNVACSAAKAKCDSSCASVIKTVDAVILKSEAAATTSPESQAILDDVRLLRTFKTRVAGQVDVCGSYKFNVMAGVAGLMSILRESQAAKTCESSLTDDSCLKDPTQVKCTNDKDDCSKAENQNSQSCICRRAPNTPGCPGAINAQVPVVSTSSKSVENARSPTAKSGPSSSQQSDDSPSTLGSSSSTGGGSGFNGGGSGGGSGLDSTNPSAKTGAVDGAAGKKGLNTNILSGYDGGGGGGGGSRGGAGGGSGLGNSAYKAYLPGGAKDPSRGTASQQFGNGEVTTAGSKSNWEKVRERYQDNKPNLMGQ